MRGFFKREYHFQKYQLFWTEIFISVVLRKNKDVASTVFDVSLSTTSTDVAICHPTIIELIGLWFSFRGFRFYSHFSPQNNTKTNKYKNAWFQPLEIVDRRYSR